MTSPSRRTAAATSTARGGEGEDAGSGVHERVGPPGRTRDAGPEKQQRRLRGPGTASTRAGLLPSPVRTGSGSAGLWSEPHSQRIRRSPEAIFSCRASLHRVDRIGVHVDLDPVQVVVVVVLVVVVDGVRAADGDALRAEPRDDLGEDVLVLGLVVALVAQAVVRVAGDVATAVRTARSRGPARSGRPCRGTRRSASASRRSPRGGALTRSCSANASAPKRTVEELVLSGSASARSRTAGSRDSPSAGRSCAIRSFGSRPDSRAANARRQLACVSPSAGDESTSRSGSGRGSSDST